ncbi:MAG: hypothetical protein AW11_00355 [Candidatus Accumulibacter regalis]|uniref:Uncharacterized protein n=1 Tax=Accumulibacter regalis TaxID=522306 RepID=A0A011RIK8_ACCRE|nr:hypothetical protein [Accumulibacter sp.]EXI91014.1 MAG: hypothetical protein AW11_00355 [Candidatus Accumulibacter regalis]HRE69442.1 hypothetical protein [Accumulibacter sp.]HRE85567.1 hypothetical protein [Accumulibacter sp.]
MAAPLPPAVAELMPADCAAAAEWLNRGCACISVDHPSLKRALEEGQGSVSHAELLATRPHLFSDSVVFVSEAHLLRMAQTIAALERVLRLPAYRERVLAYAPAIARHSPAAAGVFLGYDFHLGPDGPQLIEVNSNAGGALLNARLLRAQRACCAPVAKMMPAPRPLEAAFVNMFREEWRLARGKSPEQPLTRVAIVDTRPREQYLAPEFELFRELFEAHGIATVVADPEELSFDGERLACRGATVDLVYNRLTDFALAEAQHAALRAAYLADAVVLTPHPQMHALYADKRNLALLGDEQWLAQIGVGEHDRRLLASSIPRTEEVLPAAAEAFWNSRKQWFFKPAAGFGSKAAYRGDKVTRRVFAEIARGGYVAQALVAPSERHLLVDGVGQDFKLDLRNYVYRGEVQLLSARLYRGQTTNFRTRGGGFAAVLPVSCQDSSGGCR